MKEDYSLVQEIQVPSVISSIGAVETLIDHAASTIELNEELYGNVLIAVTEAVNNAIIHGNQLNENALISIQVLKKDADFCFVVSDNGAGFDYNNLPDPTAPENIEKENGRGVFLMKSLADDVAFNDSGNEVTIYFYNHA